MTFNHDTFKHIPDTYTLKECYDVEEIHGTVALVEHKKTKARMVLVSNDDTNKVFNIAFRTPVGNSTGVAHIIEHSVLAGSKHFPVKDPFVELVKGSLNTFLNAMTYPDKTMYPVASYNDKDFQNLIHVYLDSVFYPAIYNTKKIFQQEGWHYELEDKNSPLTINGVVYNEMKGAFSSPEQVLFREISSTLFPDTTYFFESGGDPDVIPELTYEEFLDFHKTYYHPSNSYMYLYGDFDVAEKLEFIDREFLSKFDYKKVDSQIQMQKPLNKIGRHVKAYAIGTDEDENDKYYFSYNTVIGDVLDPKLYLAFQILDYVLMSAPGAVLKKALLESKIAEDVFSSYDNGVLQPYMAIVVKNCHPESEETFVNIIKTTLEKLVKEGISKKSLEAALNYFEFKFREGDFGRFPKGLMYGLQMFDSWLYDDEKPLIHLQVYNTFKQLKEALSTDYFEQLIERYLLNNTHGSLLVLKPEKGLSTEKEKQLEEKLAAYKETLSEAELETIIEEGKALKEYQDTPSTPEELETIPMIEISDIPREAKEIHNTVTEVEGMPVLWHNIETNGIHYMKVLFDFEHLTNDLLPYTALLASVLGQMDTKLHTYGELSDEINMYTGGIGSETAVFDIVHKEDGYTPKFMVSGSALYEQHSKLVQLISEIVFQTQFDNTNRLKEIIGQLKSRLSSNITSNGHTVAALAANACYSKASWVRDMTTGIGFYRFISDLDQHFEEKKTTIINNLNTVCRQMFSVDNVLFDITADEKGLQLINPSMAQIGSMLYPKTDRKPKLVFEPKEKSKAIITPGLVQFDAIAGDFMKKGFKYHGGLQILKVIMNYEYLWQNIRVKGGAYGCMSNFSLTGKAYFITYRDPNLKESYDVFRGASDYVDSFECSDRDMTKYIIGAISQMDTPLTPSGEGARSMGLYLSEATFDMVQKHHNELLDSNIETIRSFAPLIKAFLDENFICVIGSESQINANKDMFNQVEYL